MPYLSARLLSFTLHRAALESDSEVELASDRAVFLLSSTSQFSGITPVLWELVVAVGFWPNSEC